MSQDLSSAESTADTPVGPAPAVQEATAGRPDRRTGSGSQHRLKQARRPSIVLGLLVAALLLVPSAGAAVWSALQPSTYAAQVDLLHEPSDTSASDSIDRQLATHQVLLLRRSLLNDVAEAVGRDPEELVENVTVEVVAGSSILRLQVVDQDSDRVERAAAVVADRYVGIADEFAPMSGIGRVQVVSAPTLLDEPVGPQPLRAAAAGALLGLVLVVTFLGLRLRSTRSSRPVP